MQIQEDIKDRFINFVRDVINEENPEEFLQKIHEWLVTIRDDEFRSAVRYHKALGNEIRLSIYHLVYHQPLCTCGIAAALDLPESNVTHHVKVLEDAGLIYGKKEGRYTVYLPTDFPMNHRTRDGHVFEREGKMNHEVRYLNSLSIVHKKNLNIIQTGSKRKRDIREHKQI